MGEENFVESAGEVSSDVATPSTEPAAETASGDSGSDGSSGFKFTIDSNGNPSLEIGGDSNSGADTPQEPTESTAEPATTTTEQNSIQPTTYESMEQVMQAVSSGTFDESRLTQGQRQTIAAVQQRQAFIQQQQQIKAQQEAQAEQARQQAFSQLAVQAKAAALSELGMSDDDLTNADFIEGGAERKEKFQNLYNQKLLQSQYTYIQNEFVQQQRFESYNNGLNEIQAFCTVERSKEPHYQKIISMMDTVKMDLPYSKAQKIIAAEQNISNGILTPTEIATFREYYDYCKKLAYQQESGVTTKPRPTNAVPQVEKTGTKQGRNGVPQINTANLRNMNQFQRDQAMTALIANML